MTFYKFLLYLKGWLENIFFLLMYKHFKWVRKKSVEHPLCCVYMASLHGSKPQAAPPLHISYLFKFCIYFLFCFSVNIVFLWLVPHSFVEQRAKYWHRRQCQLQLWGRHWAGRKLFDSGGGRLCILGGKIVLMEGGEKYSHHHQRLQQPGKLHFSASWTFCQQGTKLAEDTIIIFIYFL